MIIHARATHPQPVLERMSGQFPPGHWEPLFYLYGPLKIFHPLLECGCLFLEDSGFGLLRTFCVLKRGKKSHPLEINNASLSALFLGSLVRHEHMVWRRKSQISDLVRHKRLFLQFVQRGTLFAQAFRQPTAPNEWMAMFVFNFPDRVSLLI